MHLSVSREKGIACAEDLEPKELQIDGSCAIKRAMTKCLLTLTGIFAATCIACGVVYRVIGVHIDSNGTLREAFALIPIRYLSGAAGIVTGTAAMTSRRRRQRR